MKLELEVLASTSIKRKKPWPRIAWLGEVQESIFLLDDRRASVLYVPSGKTRRRIPKLHHVLENVTALCHSANGHFLAGLLISGDAFVWHKDTDMLKYIQGIPEFAHSLPNASNNANRPYIPFESPRPKLHVADDGSRLLVVTNGSHLHVWERDVDDPLFAARRADVKGAWTEVRPTRAVPMPDRSARETSVAARFFLDDTLGLCCICSFTFTVENSVCVTTAMLRWYETQHILTYSKPTLHVEWTSIQHPLAELAPGAAPVRAQGAYLGAVSHDGQLLAVAVNQKSSLLNRLLFVSPLTDTVVVSDLKGMGARLAVTKTYRNYWVADLAWTVADLFVILMTKHGAVSMVTRLGEPLLLCTFGCSIEMGPLRFLPLHPLISVRTTSPEELAGGSMFAIEEAEAAAAAAAEQDPMRQRFSLSCHPRLPIILCSDGYMVTALQLPADTSCLSLMKGLVMESTSHLRRVRDEHRLSLTLYDSIGRQGRVTKKLSLDGGQAARRRVAALTVGHKNYQPYQFEEPAEDALNHTLDEDDFANYKIDLPTMENGKIFFGDVEDLAISSADGEIGTGVDGLEGVDALEAAQRTLLLAWGVAASHSGAWTEEHEEVATNIAHNMVRLFTILLESSSADGSKSSSQHLVRVLHVLRAVLHLLRLDTPHQHLMVCAVRFAHSTTRLLLADPHLAKHESRAQTIQGCYSLLAFIERSLSCVYTLLPRTALISGQPDQTETSDSQREFLAVYEPATLSVYLDRGAFAGSAADVMATDVKPAYELLGEPPKQRKLIHPLPSEEERRQLLSFPPKRSDIDKRLAPSWKLLYTHTLRLFRHSQQTKLKGKKSIKNLLVTLQAKLTALGQGYTLKKRPKHKVQPGSRLSIEGCSVPALKAWMYQLNMPQDVTPSMDVVGRLLLSSLYSLLLQDDLRAAIELTELLLRQPDVKSAAASCRLDQGKKWSVLAMLQQEPKDQTSEPPRYVENKAVLAVVKSVARIMAAYFSNRTLFVFPPHTPRVIPPLHKTYYMKHRVIPLYHESMAAVVRQDGLDGVWTAERAIEYLLVAGLLPEAVWFANTLGDWKAAFIMGVAHDDHQRAHSALYQANEKKLELPLSIKPETILQTRFAQNFGLQLTSSGGLLIDEETDLPQLRRTLGDLLLAAVLSKIDMVPWLLEGLVNRLQQVASRFSPLVPATLYLPAPPVYCPQPADTSQAGLLGEEAAQETSLRREASSLIQLVLLVLEASHCMLPAARWYVRRVREAIQKGAKFKAPGATLTEPDVPVLQASFLGAEPAFSDAEANPSVRCLLATVRDFCSLVWLLYVRDKLSLGLRKKLQLVERKMQKSPVPSDTWLKHCRQTLHWATHLVHFAAFLQAQSEVFGIVLSLITELPPDEQSCSLLCRYFYDSDSLEPELQDKLQAVLKDWQAVFLHPSTSRTLNGASPRGTSLSIYFHKQAQRMDKFFRRKAKVFGDYEDSVFEPEPKQPGEDSSRFSKAVSKVVYVGSRPFESDESYLEFLDVFYAVSFHKALDVEKEGQPAIPLMSANAADFRQRELTSLAHKAVTSLHKRQGLCGAVPTSPRREPADLSPVRRPTPVLSPHHKRGLPSSPRSRVGLFRSRSFSELSSKRAHRPPVSPAVERKRSSSHQDLSSMADEDDAFLEVHTTKPRSSPNSDSSGGSGGSQTQSPRGRSQYSLKRNISGSDTTLSGGGVIPKMTLAKRCAFRRSSSVNDVDKAKRDKEQMRTAYPVDDPLLNPVVPATLLDKLSFGASYSELEQLLEWLSRWGGRNHTLTTRPEHHVLSAAGSLAGSQSSLSHSQQGSPRKASDFSCGLQVVAAASVEASKPAMRIKVHPRMVVYSLWLVENQYFSAPPASSQAPCKESNESGVEIDQTPPTVLAAAGPGTETTPSTLSESTHTWTLAAPVPHTDQSDRRPSTVEGEVPERDEGDHDDLRSRLTAEICDELDHAELEETYQQQILSAGSSESLSDGHIPLPKRKKMGILKKKKEKKEKDKKKKKDGGPQVATPAPTVGTSDTLMRRLSFKLSEKTPSEPSAHNVSQVSDSTLNVSSLNDEELHETMRQTVTHLGGNAKTAEKVPTAAPVGDQDSRQRTPTGGREVPQQRSKMADPGVETRLDLRRLETPVDDSDAGGLRDIVRQELRKIVDAQHRGILAMLGALGDEEDDAPYGASTPHDRHDGKKRRHGSRRRTGAGRPAERLPSPTMGAAYGTQETSFNDRSSLTEVDVTPLPSDEASIKSTADRPLTVSDLFKSKTWSPGARFDPHEVGTSVRGALRELKTLENSQSPNHVHFVLEEGGRPPPARQGFTDGPPTGKENVEVPVMAAQYEAALQEPVIIKKSSKEEFSHPPQQQYQPPLGFGSQLSAQQPAVNPDQPFARVFQMLKIVNQNLASQSGGHGPPRPGTQPPRPPLLHLTPSGSDVRFPPLASTAPVTSSAPPRGVGGQSARMPLLQLYTPHRKDELPVRDVPAHLPHQPLNMVNVQATQPTVPFRMPLLQLAPPATQPRLFRHIEDEQGDLQLVPAEDVVAFEERRREEKRRKLEQRRAQMAALGLSGPPVEAMLKKAERRDQRQTERRKQRRQKAEDDDEVRTSRENLSNAIKLSRTARNAEGLETQELAETMSQYVQVDAVPTSTQEVQVTYAPTPRELSSEGVQYPTPRSGGRPSTSPPQEPTGEEEEDSEVDVPVEGIHHGYALTPGLCDDYLMKDGEMGTAHDSAARLHYRAVSALQPRKLKEVGTETDGPGWTDQGTVICRDQGTDPVAEALQSYMAARRGLSAAGHLAPDVLMGLKFSEAGHTATMTGNEGGAPNRAFLNVVDLDAAALEDIVSSISDRQDGPSSDRIMRPSSPSKSHRRPASPTRKSPDGRRPRKAEESKGRGEEEEDDSSLGPDPVTAKVLGPRPEANRYSASGGAPSHGKEIIKQRLGDMDIQFQAIEEMSRNMEEDYKNARLMINTIEQITEAIQPTPDYVPAEAPPSSSSRDRPSARRGWETEERDDELATKLKPSHIRRFQRDDKRQDNQQEQEPQPVPELEEDGLTARERVSDIRSRLGLQEVADDIQEEGPDEEAQPEPGHSAQFTDTQMDLTGLSGVSDVIGEVLASGRIDPAGLGLSARQANRLISKAQSGRDAARIEALRKSAELQKANDAKKEEVRAWMEEKRHERFAEYKKHQQELREREPHPFKTADDSVNKSTWTLKELEDFQDKRISGKKQREKEHAERRRLMASELMGDILTEKPDLPPDLPTTDRSTARRRDTSVSPIRRPAGTSISKRSTSLSPVRKEGGRLATAGRAGVAKTGQRVAWEASRQQDRAVRDTGDMDYQQNHERSMSMTRSGLMSRSGALNTQTGTSSAGLREYTRHLEDVQDSYEPESEARGLSSMEASKQNAADQTPQATATYKPKPFTEKVRLQRPEITRQGRPRPAAQPYVKRLSEASQGGNSSRSSAAADLRAKERLYGTKRLPGTQAKRVAPRTVKTYQERLREMKQARAARIGPLRPYSGPLPGTGSASRSVTQPVRRASKPKKKPMTYSQQLQALQPPKELYRTGTMDQPSLERPLPRRRHGPPHKPMTYQEQLQKLQPPKELYRTGTISSDSRQDLYRDGPTMSSRIYRSPPQHGLRRSGPYPDPYRTSVDRPVAGLGRDSDERASVISHWEMDDDVRRLIYDDVASSSYVGASHTGTDLDLDELQELAGLGFDAASDGPAYTDLVDVREIADVASVSEGSIMSFIDWDQVNDLIADVC